MLHHLGPWVVLAGLAPLSGCGGGGTSANVVTVSVSPSQSAVIVGTTLTLNAIEGGVTSTKVTWTCTYTTTTTTGTTTTTNPAVSCSTANGAVGTISSQQDTSVIFNAPASVPDPAKFQGLLIIITATSAQDMKTTGTATLVLDSGISVVLNPVTATVPTKEQQQFGVSLTNDLQSKGVTWLITQTLPNSTTPPTPVAKLPTCSPDCGMIDTKTGLYTAPATVPTSTKVTSTPAILNVIVSANADPSRFAAGTITIIAGGPITFNGISPTIAPQGAQFWDIYLDAPFISSASKIILTTANNGTTTLTSISGQIKILFPIPNATTSNPSSTGTRVRLNAANLASAGSVTVSVTDPGEPVTTSPTGVFTYNILPVRPASTASVPDDVIQGTLSTETRVAIDGGYFGPNGSLANVLFGGNLIPQDTNNPSDARRLNTTFPAGGLNSGSPGLYPLSVTRTTLPVPTPDNPSVTNLAVFPDYSTIQPLLWPTPVSAGMNPSAIDIDPDLGVAVVVETVSNAVQFFSIGNGSLTPLGAPVHVGNVPTSVPTGVSVNRANHTAAIVNYQDQSVTVLPIPGAPQQAPGTPFTVDLSGALQGSVTPAPLPYAIGVDPDTNLALVAYSSTSTSSAANLGFVVNLNTGSNRYGCPLSTATPAPIGKCLFSQVTLNTGAYPQIAMAPHGHLAFVTPGGAGVVRGVDVTLPSASKTIASLTLGAGIVTVTTTTAHGLTPGNAGSVLITGVPTTNAAGNTNFNGVFSVAVTSSTTFAYSLTSTASGTVDGGGGKIFYNSPNLTFGVSQTIQGIAINPITRTAALADANATGQNGPQIDFLSALDQSVSSITFFSGCTAFTSSCSNAPEFLATTNLSWQPYTNSVVSYNGQQKQVSVSDPVSRRRYAIVPNLGSGAISIPVTNGTTGMLTLWGGIAVDPATNQAFVVESGNAASTGPPAVTATPGQIEIINLGPGPTNSIKPVHVMEILVPSPAPGLGVIGGVPNAIVPQATLTSASDLSGVQIFGTGFAPGAQVRLDGTPIPAANVQVVSSREITATIPASFLSVPHHYALDVVSASVQSNVTEFLVIRAIDLTGVCTGGKPQPSSVAIADQITNGPFSPIAVVTNSGCNNIAIIDINPASPAFGTLKGTAAVGTNPQGIAVSQRFGLAVVANNGDGTASVIDLTKNPPAPAVPAIQTGSNAQPMGVAINEATGAAVIANFGSNTVSELNLALLFGSKPPTTLTASNISGIQQPIAVAIDPDRGTNNQGIAVVTALQLVSGGSAIGVLAVVDIGQAVPALSTTIASGNVFATPTGIVFDPTAVTGTANQGVFYANSSGSNVISVFNPDRGGGSSVTVGINPTALAYNPQTGALLTTNFGSQTISIVDMLSSPFKTRQTLGLPGSAQFGVAIDQFTNLAVIVDQANNRVLLFPMPN